MLLIDRELEISIPFADIFDETKTKNVVFEFRYLTSVRLTTDPNDIKSNGKFPVFALILVIERPIHSYHDNLLFAVKFEDVKVIKSVINEQL